MLWNKRSIEDIKSVQNYCFETCNAEPVSQRDCNFSVFFFFYFKSKTLVYCVREWLWDKKNVSIWQKLHTVAGAQPSDEEEFPV